VIPPEDADRYAGIAVDYWEIRRPTVRPSDIMPEVRSVIVVGFALWDPVLDVAAFDGRHGAWRYPAYALMAHRAEKLAAWLLRRGFKVLSATGRLPYKRLAVLAGLGRFGKNSLVLHPRLGSGFRLACLLTDADLRPTGAPSAENGVDPSWDPCGPCERCLEACPMGALSPYTVDPEACLVALTLRERAGDINEVDPDVLRRFRALDLTRYEPRSSPNVHLMCRACQDVCPWNADAGAAG
jgi:epoxyqueuosine reductase